MTNTQHITMPGYTVEELLQLPDKGFWNYWATVTAHAKVKARRGKLDCNTHEALGRIAQAIRLGQFSGRRQIEGKPLTAQQTRET